MNTASFAGFLGRDAETKTLASGQVVTNFSIGVSTFKGQEKSTLWVACALWGERGQKLGQFLTKGSAVAVSGDVDVRAYSSNAGEPKAEITCNVQRITLQGKRDSEDRPAREPIDTSPTRAGLAKTAQQQAREANSFEPDSEIPF